MSNQRLIPLSALQHYVFCPRQCALIHNEQQWAENYLTAHGQLLHQRVDRGDPETRNGIRFERGIAVNAPTLGLTGKLDLVERELSTGKLTPVEYKRGRPKKHDADAVQLCAQALCLEEMLGQPVTQGALWYWQTHRRLNIDIDARLRKVTLEVIASVNTLFASGETPPASYFSGCKACSLRDICLPQQMQHDPSRDYLNQLFRCKDEA